MPRYILANIVDQVTDENQKTGEILKKTNKNAIYSERIACEKSVYYVNKRLYPSSHRYAAAFLAAYREDDNKDRLGSPPALVTDRRVYLLWFPLPSR